MFYVEMDGQEQYDLQRALAASLVPQPAPNGMVQVANAFAQEQYDIRRALAANLLSQPAPMSITQVASSSTLNTSMTRFLSDDPDSESEPPRKKHKPGTPQERPRSEKQLEIIAALKILQEEKRDKARNPVTVPMKYAGGALRLTRTPGRTTVNTVTMEELVHPYELTSAFIFSFCIENDYFFRFFPLKRSEEGYLGRPHCNIFVGRDLAYDIRGKGFSNLQMGRPTSDAEWDRVRETAHEEYKKQYGWNFHAFYPKNKSGCAHSKLMILIYPQFLRLVITSANFLRIDVALSDNHWFIQDFPRLSPAAAANYFETPFEVELIRHLADLECPAEFLKDLRVAVYDFSAAKVHIVSSKPGSYSGVNAETYGQLRLRHIIRNRILRPYKTVPDLTFEVCVGSVGILDAVGMVSDLLESCAGGRQDSEDGSPALKMVFPTRSDVLSSYTGLIGTIGSHMDWKALDEDDEYLKDIFYHYRSKDAGYMFHMKLILALRAGAPPAAPPLYAYLGSHNFSKGAWGRVCWAQRDSVAAHALRRLEGIANLEIGIIVKGEEIAGMLETGDWQDVVPYVRPSAANKYKEGECPYRAPPPQPGMSQP